jgi:hypothetical protein
MESVERLIVDLGGIVADSEHARTARVVDIEGEPTLWVLPGWAHGRECRDAMLAKLVLELSERRGGAGTVRRQISELLRSRVPTVLWALAGAQVWHVSARDVVVGALNVLWWLPYFFGP